MRIHHLDEGVGRIVKGVNTTPDVGPNQTSIEAAKFGNKVDKDGRPPTLSKNVKGNSTNVLFNLGITEGIKLKLERDKNMDVLHIQDTNEKSRVEVRGKKDYESGGYDANDKLHQVLDRVGKAANISDLMNGDVVHINPNHPQGSRAIRTARDVLQTEETRLTAMEQACIEGGHDLNDLYKQVSKVTKPGGIFEALNSVTEALDNPYPVRWIMKDDDEWEGKAKTEAGDSIQIMITQGHNNHKWEIDFYVGGSMQVTGKGDQFRVFATVVSAVKEWWSWLSKSKQPVEAIIFSAFKGNEDTKGSAGRSNLYRRFANQFARSIRFEVSSVDGSDNIKFVLSNPNYKDQQTENFADGKKKGKSRPGRFKKAGVSCKGSVTSLRKKAKNASGERQKGYHFCANMKSGRKKG